MYFPEQVDLIMCFTGMGSFRVIISRKQLKDMERSRFINGVEVMMFGHPMERVWKCAWEGLLRILKSM